ncbi:unnamed protein product, partial [Didymodactylos carnosus]
CQNIQRRRLSSLKIAYYLIAIVIVFSILIYAEIFYCNDANLLIPPLPCYAKNYPCRLYNDFTFALIFVVIPCLLMCIFGYLTILNIRKLHRSVVPTSGIRTKNSKDTRNIKKSDRQLIQMLLIQVLLLTMFTLPIAIQRLYATLTINTVKSQLSLTIENFLFQLLLSFTFISMSIPFYVYLLTGTIFRQRLIALFHNLVAVHRVQLETSTIYNNN